MADTMPAYRVETDRLCIRCWEPLDAPMLQAAVQASVEHLSPWMPWAREEPEPLETKIERLRMFRGNFDLGQNYIYAAFSADESQVVGGTGLHPRVGAGGFETGYWVHVDHTNKGYATEMAAAMTRLAFEVHDMAFMEIRCDPENVYSAAIPRRLGYRHVQTLPLPADGPDEPLRDTMIWSMAAADYRGSGLAGTPLRAIDVMGRTLIES